MIEGGFTVRRMVNRCYCSNCGVEVSDKALQLQKLNQPKEPLKSWNYQEETPYKRGL